MSHILDFKDWFKVYESAGFKYKPGMAIFEKDDKDKKKDKKLPKDLDKRIKTLVDMAVDNDSRTVKNTAKSNSYWVRPWDAIMDWMYARGTPGKETENVAKLLEIHPDYKRRFENMKPTMGKDYMAKCMEWWNGIFDETTGAKTGSVNINGKEYKQTTGGAKESSWDTAISRLKKFSTPGYVNRVVRSWKSADAYPDDKQIKGEFFPTKFKIFGKDFTFNQADISFDKELIVSNSKILLDAVEELEKSGKSPRISFKVDFDKTKEVATTKDDKSMCLFPDLKPANSWERMFDKDISDQERNKYVQAYGDDTAIKEKYSKDRTAAFFIWYTIISNPELFKELQNKLSGPQAVRTDYVKITEQDKIDIINGIMEMANERWGKSKTVSPEDAIYWASAIMWWPTKAKETMPVISTPAAPGTTIETPADEPIEITNTYDFAWPYKNGAPGRELAMTYFKSDSAQIQDGKDKEIQNAVDQIMNEIKSKNGTLTKLSYRVVASTSDEPSAYQANGTIDKTKYSAANNNYLVVARAKVIEDALQTALTTSGIDKTLVTKDPDRLIPNNTLNGTAVYQEKKWMRLDHKGSKATATAETDAEYKKLFAEPKHSGILFNVEYTTTEVVKNDPNIEIIEDEPDETKGYSVTGEWYYEIVWSGKAPRRRKGRRKPFRKWPHWNIKWPVLQAGSDILSVEDLCCAYGNC